MKLFFKVSIHSSSCSHLHEEQQWNGLWEKETVAFAQLEAPNSSTPDINYFLHKGYTSALVQYSPGNLDIYAFEELANNIWKAEPSSTQGTFSGPEAHWAWGLRFPLRNDLPVCVCACFRKRSNRVKWQFFLMEVSQLPVSGSSLYCFLLECEWGEELNPKWRCCLKSHKKLTSSSHLSKHHH